MTPRAGAAEQKRTDDPLGSPLTRVLVARVEPSIRRPRLATRQGVFVAIAAAVQTLREASTGCRPEHHGTVHLLSGREFVETCGEAFGGDRNRDGR